MRESIRTIVKELSPDASNGVANDCRLVDDLGYHSLALLELAFALETSSTSSRSRRSRRRSSSPSRNIADYVVDQLRARL